MLKRLVLISDVLVSRIHTAATASNCQILATLRTGLRAIVDRLTHAAVDHDRKRQHHTLGETFSILSATTADPPGCNRGGHGPASLKIQQNESERLLGLAKHLVGNGSIST